MAKAKVAVPIAEVAKAVQGRKAGAVTNGSVWLENAGDTLAGVVKAAARETVLLYGEHGTRGDEGSCAPRPSTYDEYMGCEARSLHQYTSDPLGTDVVADCDVVVIGLHDTGCRHYSYKATTCHVMEVAARAGKPVVMVDLPNPVRGDVVEGNYPDTDFYEKISGGTIGYVWFGAPITYRHGMTMGELALMAKDHLKLDLDLQIIKLEGWRRDMWWEDTGWPYLPFDPSTYSPATTRSFLCTGLLQGTNLSWGIGTADPFSVVGAPWIKDDRLLKALRQRGLAGVTWSRAHFVPRWHEGTWGRFAGEPCNGVKLHITDRNALCTSEVQLSLIVALLRLYPNEFDILETSEHYPEGTDWFDLRLEDQQWSRRLKAGEGVDSILAEWKAMSKKFEEIRQSYLLYQGGAHESQQSQSTD